MAVTSKNRLKPVDVVIGTNLRRLRLSRRMSQEALGDKCGVTFQQIQKYEKGTNGMRGSRIVQICDILRCTLGDLFTGTLAGKIDVTAADGMDFLATHDGQTIIQNWPKVPVKVRKTIRDLIANSAEG